MLDLFGRQVAVVDRLDLALQPAQVEEELLLGRRGADFHQGPGVQDIFLDGRADPPHGVGGQPEAPVRLEPLDRLHQAHIALGDQIPDGEAVAPVAHGDLGHQAKMAGDEAMRGFGVVMFAPALRQHEFLLGREEGELPNLAEIAIYAVSLRRRWERSGGGRHCPLLRTGGAWHPFSRGRGAAVLIGLPVDSNRSCGSGLPHYQGSFAIFVSSFCQDRGPPPDAASRSPPISTGSGLSKVSVSPVVGWVKRSRTA